MADAAQQQNLPPKGEHPPFFEPSTPEDQEALKKAEKERAEVHDVLSSIGEKEAQQMADRLTQPPTLETSPAYQAKKAQDARSKEAQEAMVELPPPLETSPAYLAQQAKKALEKYRQIEKMTKKERIAATSALTADEMRLILLELEDERAKERAKTMAEAGGEEKIIGTA